MKRETFNRGITLLVSAFQVKEISKETIKVYWETLKNYHDNDFKIAVNNIIRTKNWFPKIAELITELLPQNEIRTAAEEWDDLLRAAEADRDCPNISPRAVRALAVAGGYDQFKYTDYEGLRYAYQKFERAYNLIQESEIIQKKLGYRDFEPIGNVVQGLLVE